MSNKYPIGYLAGENHSDYISRIQQEKHVIKKLTLGIKFEADNIEDNVVLVELVANALEAHAAFLRQFKDIKKTGTHKTKYGNFTWSANIEYGTPKTNFGMLTVKEEEDNERIANKFSTMIEKAAKYLQEPEPLVKSGTKWTEKELENMEHGKILALTKIAPKRELINIVTEHNYEDVYEYEEPEGIKVDQEYKDTAMKHWANMLVKAIVHGNSCVRVLQLEHEKLSPKTEKYEELSPNKPLMVKKS